jgi:hypothetical protein
MKELVAFLLPRTETFRLLAYQLLKLWAKAGCPNVDDIEVSIRREEKAKK